MAQSQEWMKKLDESFLSLSLAPSPPTIAEEPDPATPNPPGRHNLAVQPPDSAIASLRHFSDEESSNGHGNGHMRGNSGHGHTRYHPRYMHGPIPLAYPGPGPRGGIRHSRTWVSEDAKMMQDWVVTRNAMRRLFRHSEVAKWKYSDYVAHREAMVASAKALLNKKLRIKEEEHQKRLALTQEDYAYAESLGHSVSQCLNWGDNRSLVLGERTIWCLDWQNGKEEIAPWPTLAEMKWEGDDRAKTNVGRFLPLPREIGAPGITWAQLQVVEQYPLDQVQKVPTLEDILLPVDEIDDEVKYNLITKELEDAMDEYLES